jgi:hypothetical protein
MHEDGPVLRIAVELESSVWEKSQPVAPQVSEAVRETIKRLMQTLGVPGYPLVEVFFQPHSRQGLQLRVSGHLCRFPDVLLNNTQAYLTGTQRRSETNLERLLAWITNEFEQMPERAITTVAQVCEAVVEQQPEVLVQDEQAAAYARRLDDNSRSTDTPKLDGARLKRVLRGVLRARCSLADIVFVRRAVSGEPGSEEEVIDRIVRNARTGVIEIRAGKELHGSLVAAGRERELVSFARDGLYEETGVLYPEIRLVVDPDIRPAAFRFRINSLDTSPLLGLGNEEVLVNETAERLKLMEVDATPTLNVATDQPAAVVDVLHTTKLEAEGLMVWDQWGFVILALADSLRRNAGCFIDSDFTNMQLRRLARDHPKLVTISRQEIPVARLTGALRGLAEEQVPIRDLKMVLERLLDWRYERESLCRYVVLDDRLLIGEQSILDARNTSEPTLEFVRSGLKPQLAHKFSRRTGTLVVYLLSDEIERIVMLGGDGHDGFPSEADSTRILEALHSELANLPPTAWMPLLLTSGAARLKINRLVHGEIPRMSVLAHEELPRDLNVQPVARISLPT